MFVKTDEASGEFSGNLHVHHSWLHKILDLIISPNN